MRNTVKASILIASLLAASALGAPAHAEQMNGAIMRDVPADGGKNLAAPPARVAKDEDPGNGARKHRRRAGLGGGFLDIADLLPHTAFMQDDDTGFRKDCLYVAGCKITVYSGPDVTPQPPIVEKRKRAPEPRGHWKDPRTGWTFYLQNDRNGGGQFIQIEDANGNDVHLDGAIQMPGPNGGTALIPVR
jgi:hypothetical protein